MYYLQSRYYNPALGRFINADVFASTGQGLLGNNMFAYCRNSPVFRIDISGTCDVECGDENPMNGEESNNDFGPGGAINSTDTGANSGGYSYTPTPGGGGVTTSVKVGNTTVTFRHGGRHMEFNDISGLETAIANNVVMQPPSIGKSMPVSINYCGVEITYRYFTLNERLINVGTYFYKAGKD